MDGVNLPDGFVSEYLLQVKGARIFDVPVEALERDQLLAVVGFAFSQVAQLRGKHSNDLDVLGCIRQRRVDTTPSGGVGNSAGGDYCQGMRPLNPPI